MKRHPFQRSVGKDASRPVTPILAGAAAFSAAVLAGLFGLPGTPLAPTAASATCIVDEARCSCMPNPDFEALHDGWVEAAELIVRARVVALDTLALPVPDPIPPHWPGNPIVAHLAVDELWKGSVEEGALVLSLTHTHLQTSCDLRYAPGAEILLYGRRDPNTDRWGSSICAGTTNIGHARTRGDLARLGPGVRPGG
jgi:hypothetical protein